ncbi:MAG: dethiobiotin synthase [Gammaproteobacteria bacterium]|nr:dethiobiotin synthase [Gammaproteobacteria bacterium]
MAHHFFITGTDTDIGKTYVTVGLLKAFNRAGYKTVGLKPVASGCNLIDAALQNQDALSLQENSTVQLPYPLINPFAFEDPIAPHFAAHKAGTELSCHVILRQMEQALNYAADIFCIEGVGGWQVPLNATETMADLVQQAQWPVILVVGIRLGCLSHAILTYESLQMKDIPIAGWIANVSQPHLDNVLPMTMTLQRRFAAPCLGMIGYQQPAEDRLDIGLLQLI